MNELEMIITAFLTRARARLPAVFWVKCHLSWRRSSSLADSSAAGGFPVATATGFYARGAALQTNEGKHSFLFIILSPPPCYIAIRSFCFWHTHCVSVCVCAGHDGGGASPPARQGTGPHGLGCKVRPPHRHHQGVRQLGRKRVVGGSEGRQ